jgi:D-lyxose ketol-isomerase
MKRSDINRLYREAKTCFEKHGWALPPRPRWDITDFGLDDLEHHGLVLINLADEPEYCEKLMYARKGQTTPLHTHRRKKEDIICRLGALTLELWSGHPDQSSAGEAFTVQINGEPRIVCNGKPITLKAGERMTLTPGIYHAFWPAYRNTIIGEVSTANDDAHDNFFVNPAVGRFPGIKEDEPADIKLISE